MTIKTPRLIVQAGQNCYNLATPTLIFILSMRFRNIRGSFRYATIDRLIATGKLFDRCVYSREMGYGKFDVTFTTNNFIYITAFLHFSKCHLELRNNLNSTNIISYGFSRIFNRVRKLFSGRSYFQKLDTMFSASYQPAICRKQPFS